ncbi:MAG: polysaccharide export protein [bacterium]|nr:polysaccharide export protein [bacterium]
MFEKTNRNLTMAVGVCLTLLVSSCGGGQKYATGGDTQVYPKEDLGRFQRATMPSPTTNEYYIGIGDRLDVVFFFNSELTTPNLLVRRDGRITLPYVGDVMAAGVTPMELDSTLTEQFSEILRDPNVSVIVVDSEDRRIYVLGEVSRPGGFTFDESVSVSQALALAGGLLPSAKEEYALVMRREGLDTVLGLRLDVKAILAGIAVQNDIELRNEDVIYIPKTRMASAGDWMQEFDRIIGPPINILFKALQSRTLLLQLDLLENQR